MNKSLAKKYLSSINKAKGKHLTSEKLSRDMGIYPEIIREQLSFFEPLLQMDLDYNIRDLVPAIEEYIKEEEAKTEKVERIVIKKSEVDQYESIADFFYQKFTINGLVSRDIALSEVDLRTLRKLVDSELAKVVKKPKNKSKKRH